MADNILTFENKVEKFKYSKFNIISSLLMIPLAIYLFFLLLIYLISIISSTGLFMWRKNVQISNPIEDFALKESIKNNNVYIDYLDGNDLYFDFKTEARFYTFYSDLKIEDINNTLNDCTILSLYIDGNKVDEYLNILNDTTHEFEFKIKMRVNVDRYEGDITIDGLSIDKDINIEISDNFNDIKRYNRNLRIFVNCTEDDYVFLYNRTKIFKTLKISSSIIFIYIVIMIVKMIILNSIILIIRFNEKRKKKI